MQIRLICANFIYYYFLNNEINLLNYSYIFNKYKIKII